MRQGIHPEYHVLQAKCACGALTEVGTTLPELKLDICSQCHPFFTGTQKVLDTEGRVERFKKRFEAKQDNAQSVKQARRLEAAEREKARLEAEEKARIEATKLANKPAKKFEPPKKKEEAPAAKEGEGVITVTGDAPAADAAAAEATASAAAPEAPAAEAAAASEVAEAPKAEEAPAAEA